MELKKVKRLEIDQVMRLCSKLQQAIDERDAVTLAMEKNDTPYLNQFTCMAGTVSFVVPPEVVLQQLNVEIEKNTEALCGYGYELITEVRVPNQKISILGYVQGGPHNRNM